MAPGPHRTAGPALWALREIIEAATLPVLSESHMLVMAWLDDPAVEPDDLVGPFLQDPSLAFNLLSFAQRRGLLPRMAIADALAAVGVLGVRELMESLEVVRGLGLPEGVSIRGWVDHSVNVALVAQLLARAEGADAELAYLLGLLHDVGTLALLRAAPATFGGALDDPQGPYLSLGQGHLRAPALEWSAMLLGATLARGALLQGLTAAACARYPRDAPGAVLGAVLRKAHTLCEDHRAAFHWDRLQRPDDEAAFGPERQTTPNGLNALSLLALH